MTEVIETETTGSTLGVVIILAIIGLAMIGIYRVGTLIGTIARKSIKKY